MNPAITIELQFFLISILWGGILLVVYDILRIIRRIIKHGAFLIAVQDMIFWTAASLFIFSMIYRENNGIIRGYSILGMMLGSIFYHFAFSDFIVKLISKLIETLLQPFKAALNQLVRLFKLLRSTVGKSCNNLLLGLKKWKISVKMKHRKSEHKESDAERRNPGKKKPAKKKSGKKSEKKNSEKKSREKNPEKYPGKNPGKINPDKKAKK